jgi:hypothetical protein
MPLGSKKHPITIQLMRQIYLPGCAATGATFAEVQQQIKEAMEFHLEGLRGIARRWFTHSQNNYDF